MHVSGRRPFIAGHVGTGIGVGCFGSSSVKRYPFSTRSSVESRKSKKNVLSLKKEQKPREGEHDNETKSGCFASRLISSKESLAKEARAGLARFSKEETFYA